VNSAQAALQVSPEEDIGLHDTASMSQPDTVAAAATQAAEEMQRRLAEVERRERALLQRENQLYVQQQRVQSVALSSSSSSSSSVVDAGSAPVRVDVRVAAVQPPELSYANASGGSALEDWLFKLEQLFAQTRTAEAAWQERVRTAQLHWDRHMSLWWAGCAEAAASAGVPVDSWPAFVAALRKHFVPTGDAEAARTELFRLRMRGGESMDAYLQRAVLIVARAGAFVDGKMAGALAIEGVDVVRFPFTVQAVRGVQRKAGVQGLSFAQARVELSTGAHDEPHLQLPQARGGSNGNAADRGGQGYRVPSKSAGTSGSKQVRINALRQQLQALEEEDAGGDEREAAGGVVQVAPLGRGAGSTRGSACYKCGGEGHIVAECTSKKELRTCYRCGKAGHVRSKCPDKKQQRDAARGAGEEGSKNE
jgi:hypothetical protein